MTTNGSGDSAVEIEDAASGVEVAEATLSKKSNAKSSNQRRGRAATDVIDPVSQGLQDSPVNTNLSVPLDQSAETPSHPIIPTGEEDLPLEGWESGYDLPRTRQ
jgi:hypothetical protein